MLEAILEGLTKDPKTYIAMGLGFFVGYEGYDVLQWFTKNLTFLRTDAAGGLNPLDAAVAAPMGVLGLVPGQIDVMKMATFPWLVNLQNLVSTAKNFKQGTPEERDTDFEKRLAEFKGRLILGSLGALTALMLTTPGFLSGVGEIVKGIGEIVPL